MIVRKLGSTIIGTAQVESISIVQAEKFLRYYKKATKYEANQDAKALVMVKKISPAAWGHIHLNGHYTFRVDGQILDLDAIVAGLNLACDGIFWGLSLHHQNGGQRTLKVG